jgi:hypothetical protein
MKRYHQAHKFSAPGVDVLDVKRASDRHYAITNACQNLHNYGHFYRPVYV